MMKRIIVALGITASTAIGSKMTQDAILKKDGWVYDKTQKGWYKQTSDIGKTATESKIMTSNMIWTIIGFTGGLIGYFCTRK